MTMLNDRYLLKLYRTAGTLTDVPKAQANVSIVRGALTNLNGRYLSAYTAQWRTIGGYGCYQIKYNNAILDVTKAGDYMENMSGSRFVPTYNYEKPVNSLFIFATDFTLWKPQYDPTNGLLLFAAGRLTLYSDLMDLKNVTELEINNLKSIVYDTVAAVEEYDEDYAGILPNPTSVNSKPVIDDTKCQLAKIFGNSVVKNNYAKELNTTNWGDYLYASILTINSGVLTATTNNASNRVGFGQAANIIANHKYLFVVNITSASEGLSLRLSTRSNPYTNVSIGNNAKIIEATNSANEFGVYTETTSVSGAFISCDFFKAVDLTQYFGSNDNIPADLLTDPTLWAKYIKDTDYNTGELVDSVVNKISSFDTNDNKLGEILINQTLKGAINAHDTIEFVEQENGTFNAVKTSNIGNVDLGTIDWVYNSTDLRFDSGTNILGGKQYPISVVPNMIISKYTAVSGSYFDSNISVNGIFRSNDSLSTQNGRIFIRDLDYTDTTAFKNAMSGVMLSFELETPTTEVIATGLTLDEVAFLIKLGGYIETDADNVAPNIKLAYIVKDFQE